ncbi:MAG TPA: response regulator [Desulfohalobiaceae bacterium]|nr:response regulator [Desulfohalobiaceae bacterium]
MTDKKRVLVVDDDPDFVNIMQHQLEKLRCEVDVAYNGVEGLERVKTKRPDVIVLDVMMPEKDGFQMCKELKQDETLLDIPVIMLTAVADHISSTGYTQYDAMSMEADDYIPKGPDCSQKTIESLKDLLNL